MIWYDMRWYGMVWYGMLWYDTVYFVDELCFKTGFQDFMFWGLNT